MNIVDLCKPYHQEYMRCLCHGDPTNCGRYKERWVQRVGEKLRVKLAAGKDGPVGMIQYLPIELTRARGDGYYFIQCIWVHGYESGPGNMQHKGIGTELLFAAEADVRQAGAKGLAGWGMDFEEWMPVSWYLARGFKEADRKGPEVLVYKAFDTAAETPYWVRMKKLPGRVPGKTTVHLFVNGWCQGGNHHMVCMKEAAENFPEEVVLQEFDTSDPAVFEEWGVDDAIFIDGEQIPFLPDPTVEHFRSILEEKIVDGE
ncbi:MAG: hypothetical protein ACLFVU_05985 [Phycisphaerae bacterium]